MRVDSHLDDFTGELVVARLVIVGYHRFVIHAYIGAFICGKGEGLSLRNVPFRHLLAVHVEHALATCRAQLAEAVEPAEAAGLYAGAAERWREFGNVPERAYALLGQGRSLAALDLRVADAPLREARELFESMGYRPALEECDALLARAATAARSG